LYIEEKLILSSSVNFVKMIRNATKIYQSRHIKQTIAEY